MQLIPLNGIKTTFKLRILTHLVNSGELQGVGGMTKIIRPTKEFIKCTFRSQRSHLYPFISQHYFKSHWSSYAILGDECCTNIIILLSCDLRFSKHICKRNAIYYSLCLCDYCHQCSSYIFFFLVKNILVVIKNLFNCKSDKIRLYLSKVGLYNNKH